MKRTLALLLAVMMVFSLLPLSAFADDAVDGSVPAEIEEEVFQTAEDENPAPEDEANLEEQAEPEEENDQIADAEQNPVEENEDRTAAEINQEIVTDEAEPEDTADESAESEGEELCEEGGITISGAPENGLAAGETCQLEASPSDNIQWTLCGSNDLNFATVNAISGLVTALDDVTSAHTIKVKAFDTTDPDTYGICEITIIPAGTYVRITSGVIICDGKECYDRLVSDDQDGYEYIIDTEEENTLPLSAKVFPAESDQTVTWTSSNPNVASVDESGVVTVVDYGKVAITATTSNGISNRVIFYFRAAPLETLQVGPADTAELENAFTETLPKGGEPNLVGYFQGLNDDGDEAEGDDVTQWVAVIPKGRYPVNGLIKLTGTKTFDKDITDFTGLVTWTTSSSANVKVDENTDTEDDLADYTLWVNPASEGKYTVTFKSVDDTTIIAKLTVIVVDFAPRMETTRLTINTYEECEAYPYGWASVPLVACHENPIDPESIELTVPTKENLTATFDSETDMVTIWNKSEEVISNRTISTVLHATCTKDNKTYSFAVTITIKNTLPTVTLKQLDKFNTFYTDETTDIQVTAKMGSEVKAVDAVEIGTKSSFTIAEFDADTCVAKLEANPSIKTGAINKTVPFIVYVDGYNTPVEKTVTISAVCTKPTLVLSPAKTVLNSAIGSMTSYICIYDKTNGEYIDAEIIEPASYYVDVNDVDEDHEEGEPIELKMVIYDTSAVKSGKVTLNVQGQNWSAPVAVSQNVSLIKTLPTVKLGTTSFTVNKAFPSHESATTMKLSQDNLSIDDEAVTFEIISAPSKIDKEEAAGLFAFTYDDDADTLTLTPSVDEDTPTGTYKFKLTASLADFGTALKPVTITVNVTNKLPTATVTPSSISLNAKYVGETAQATVKTNDKVVTSIGLDVEPDERMSETALEWANTITIDTDENIITATLTDEEIPNGSYKFKVTPTASDAEGDDAELKPIYLTVRVYRTTGSASASAKGSLNALDRDGSAIYYTITKVNNVKGTISDVSIATDEGNGDLFEFSYDNETKIGTLKLKSDEDYSSAKTYKIKLAVQLDGIDEPVYTSFLSVKVNMPAMKLSTNPTSYKAYVAEIDNRTMVYTIKVTSPSEAVVSEDGITVGNIGSWEAALNSRDIAISEDGKTITVTVKLGDVSQLKTGKTYTLPLTIIPNNATVNYAGVKVNLKFTVAK